MCLDQSTLPWYCGQPNPAAFISPIPEKKIPGNQFTMVGPQAKVNVIIVP